MTYKTQVQQMIQEQIERVCPYEDAARQRLYHIGFLTAQLAEAMLADNKNYYRFLAAVKRVEERNQRL
jgi:nitrate reductase assembly molybdenum cofactor insertion protein NarJ